VFFPQIAEKLVSITPLSITEPIFINTFLQMIYEPEEVKINGASLQGAFIFEGLLNFHGVIANVRMVMDPDTQKYLFYTLVMPSFALSKNNIKFLSPYEYIEILQPSTK
jgi:hypothetical protein